MNAHPESYLSLARSGAAWELALQTPDSEIHRWRVGDRAPVTDQRALVRALLEACPQGPIFSLQAEELSELFSRGELLPVAGPVLGRLVNLRQVRRVLVPHEASRIETRREYEPEALLAATVQVRGLLEQRFRAMPAELLAVLQPLLAADESFAWLPWPPRVAHSADLLLLSSLLAHSAVPRRTSRDGAPPPGDLRDLAESILGPGGAIEEALPAYEHRRGQVQMAREVAEVLQEGGFLLAEAGTGIGKSLAYLVPAVLWARRESAPVVISTNTRNLQAQLMEKDLPLLAQALPFRFEAALLKGRANYPCVRSLVSACTDAAGSLFRSERLAAAFLVSWLVQTPGGDLEELEAAAVEELEALPTLLARVRSRGDACAGSLCSYMDCCPVHGARARAREADLIVVNHALMLAEAKSQVLPDYSRLVVDEAHNLEAVATDALALEFSSQGATQMLRAVVGGPGNLTDLLRRRLPDLPYDPLHTLVEKLVGSLPESVETFHHATEALGEMLYDFTFEHDEGRGDSDRATLRLTEKVRQTEEWAAVARAGAAALSDGLALHAVMTELTRTLKELCKGARPGVEGLDADAESMRLRIATALEALAAILEPERSQGYVTWSEAWRTRGGEAWSLKAAPIDVSRVLDEALLSHKEAVVFTSATLTVDGAFAYYRQRTGLNLHAERLTEMLAPSPFDLTEQLLLCVPSDMPEPSAPEYNQAVVDALGRICEVTRGGTLALFTARTRMHQAYSALKQCLENQGMTPLCQDLTGPRWELLERLKADPTSVLFGLKSFWEGVDVPGDALRCVVIAKLPFGVPTDPILQARQEHARAQGLNPMEDYYLPEAILAFKQGFGRLIRTAKDTGVVFVLDRRILTRPYGRRFFRSIQRCQLSREPLATCLAQAAGWLGHRTTD